MSVIYIVILPLDGVEIKLSPARQGNPLSLQKGRKDFYLPAAQGESPVNLAILTTPSESTAKTPSSSAWWDQVCVSLFPSVDDQQKKSVMRMRNRDILFEISPNWH